MGGSIGTGGYTDIDDTPYRSMKQDEIKIQKIKPSFKESIACFVFGVFITLVAIGGFYPRTYDKSCVDKVFAMPNGHSNVECSSSSHVIKVEYGYAVCSCKR